MPNSFSMKKVFVFITAWMLLLVLKAHADHTMVILSDPHVMASSLLKSPGSAWDAHLSESRKLVDYSQPLFDEMIDRIKNDIKPQLVLITGDLTKDAEVDSHHAVLSKLNELRAAGIKTLVVPGNHDRGTHNQAVCFDGSSATPVPTVNDDTFATLYAHYGYDVHSEREGSTLTYAAEPFAGLVVIGIDTGVDGVIPPATLKWVCAKAVEAQGRGKRVIAMMHHPLIPHLTRSHLFVKTSFIENSDAVRNALVKAGVKVVFSGHFHISDIAKDYDDELTDSIYDVNTGSLDSFPCDYRVVRWSDDWSQMHLTTHHITALPGHPEFSTEYARKRLHDSIKHIVTQKAVSKLGALAPMLKEPIKVMATNVADAYIIHARGNEHQVNTEHIFTNLAPAFEMLGGLEDMFKSMLHDLAPYGIPHRENRTDDHTLIRKP